MLSWASDGGGVGPHLDSYDVFLLQVQGRRRWRVGRVRDRSLRRRPAAEDPAPLRARARLAARARRHAVPAAALGPRRRGRRRVHDRVGRLSRARRATNWRASCCCGWPMRDDAERRATPSTPTRGSRPRRPGPRAAAHCRLRRRRAARRAAPAAGAGSARWASVLSEPKPQVWFDAPAAPAALGRGLAAGRAQRMLYDARHVFVNGESWRVGGRDARLLRQLADRRVLGAADRARLERRGARRIVHDWLADGWLQRRGRR